MSQDDETTTRSVTATDPFGKTSPAQNFTGWNLHPEYEE